MHSSKLLKIARQTLIRYKFSEDRGGYDLVDQNLAKIAKVCLSDDSNPDDLKKIYESAYEAIINTHLYGSSLPKFLKTLSEKHPKTFLDIFLEKNAQNNLKKSQIFSYNFERSNNPLNNIADEVLTSWCEEYPKSRYPLITDYIQPFEKSKEAENLAWKKIIYSVFDYASDLEAILNNLSNSIIPSSGIGSLADILQTRLVLFEELKNHPNEEVRTWAKNQLFSLRQEIENIREQENKRNREDYESFE